MTDSFPSQLFRCQIPTWFVRVSWFVVFPAAQFFRCLWQTLNLKLSAEDEQAMINKYDMRRDGTINYRLFCEEINLSFNPSDLKKDPVEQKVEPAELWVCWLLLFCILYWHISLDVYFFGYWFLYTFTHLHPNLVSTRGTQQFQFQIGWQVFTVLL